MRHSSALLTPAQCLLRALSPKPHRSIVPRRVLRAPQASFSVCTRRPAAGFFVHRNRVAGTGNGPRLNAPKQDVLSDFVKDNEIRAPGGVQVVQPDGKLGPVEQLPSVLLQLNAAEEHLIQVSPPDDKRPTAIVKVFKRADLIRQKREKQKAQQKQQKSMKDKAPKQIELNWAIGPRDLEMKLGQLESFIEKGKTVEIILAAKRKQRRASVEEGEEVLKKIRDKMVDIDGKEVKPMEGQLLKQAILTIRKKGVD